MIKVIVTFFVVIMLSGCTAFDARVTRDGYKSNDIPRPEAIEANYLEDDPYKLVESHIDKQINSILRELRLTALRNSPRTNKFEVWLWTNLGGIGNPKLLIVQSTGRENRGIYYDTGKDPALRDSVSAKTGWEKSIPNIKEVLNTPYLPVPDPAFDLDRDEPVIMLEMIDRGEYRRVFYGYRTTFTDGKRLVGLCIDLNNELSIEMDCPKSR